MKKRIISLDDIPDNTNVTHGMASPVQDAIEKFIIKNPNCTRRDLYSLPYPEGHIRRSITTMLKSNKVKETFTIVR